MTITLSLSDPLWALVEVRPSLDTGIILFKGMIVAGDPLIIPTAFRDIWISARRPGYRPSDTIVASGTGALIGFVDICLGLREGHYKNSPTSSYFGWVVQKIINEKLHK